MRAGLAFRPALASLALALGLVAMGRDRRDFGLLELAHERVSPVRGAREHDRPAERRRAHHLDEQAALAGGVGQDTRSVTRSAVVA